LGDVFFYKETVKCPAEESANSRRSPPTNGRRSSEKTGTRTNRICPQSDEALWTGLVNRTGFPSETFYEQGVSYIFAV
jgi:hypothetical protein